MHRVLISRQEVSGSRIVIATPEIVRHLGVLRVRAGESIECFDGAGTVYRGRVAQCLARRIEIDVTGQRTEPAAAPRITLAVGLIRPERFEWIVEKATELGVASVVPLYTHRARSRPAGGGAATRSARWQRIAAEAAAQSGRAFVPIVSEPQEFDEFVGGLRGQPALLCTLQADGAGLDALSGAYRGTDALTLLIGPEGDFTDDEVALASAAGARAVRLGRGVLRSETAAIAALAIVQHTLKRL